MENKKELVKPVLVEEKALAKIQAYMELGMTIPEGFSPANSLKKARFMLNDMKVGGKPVLEVCTEESVMQALLDSVAKGLDFSESQIYFIPRNNQMTTMESVYGRIVRAKRASKYYKPIVGYVHEGDIFDFGIDVNTGYTKIIEHKTSVENLDKPFIAAYAYVTDNDGNTDVFVMTRKEWLKSWTKSSNGASVAKEFERDMIYRTIIKKSTKSLVNSNVKYMGVLIDDEDDIPLAGETAPMIDKSKVGEVVEYEEVTETVDASTLNNKEELSGANASAGEPETIKEEKKKQVKVRPF
jgi:recombination protein RecT